MDVNNCDQLTGGSNDVQAGSVSEMRDCSEVRDSRSEPCDTSCSNYEMDDDLVIIGTIDAEKPSAEESKMISARIKEMQKDLKMKFWNWDMNFSDDAVTKLLDQSANSSTSVDVPSDHRDEPITNAELSSHETSSSSNATNVKNLNGLRDNLSIITICNEPSESSTLQGCDETVSNVEYGSSKKPSEIISEIIRRNISESQESVSLGSEIDAIVRKMRKVAEATDQSRNVTQAENYMDVENHVDNCNSRVLTIEPISESDGDDIHENGYLHTCATMSTTGSSSIPVSAVSSNTRNSISVHQFTSRVQTETINSAMQESFQSETVNSEMHVQENIQAGAIDGVMHGNSQTETNTTAMQGNFQNAPLVSSLTARASIVNSEAQETVVVGGYKVNMVGGYKVNKRKRTLPQFVPNEHTSPPPMKQEKLDVGSHSAQRSNDSSDATSTTQKSVQPRAILPQCRKQKNSNGSALARPVVSTIDGGASLSNQRGRFRGNAPAGNDGNRSTSNTSGMSIPMPRFLMSNSFSMNQVRLRYNSPSTICTQSFICPSNDPIASNNNSQAVNQIGSNHYYAQTVNQISSNGNALAMNQIRSNIYPQAANQIGSSNNSRAVNPIMSNTNVYGQAMNQIRPNRNSHPVARNGSNIFPRIINPTRSSSCNSQAVNQIGSTNTLSNPLIRYRLPVTTTPLQVFGQGQGRRPLYQLVRPPSTSSVANQNSTKRSYSFPSAPRSSLPMVQQTTTPPVVILVNKQGSTVIMTTTPSTTPSSSAVGFTTFTTPPTVSGPVNSIQKSVIPKKTIQLHRLNSNEKKSQNSLAKSFHPYFGKSVIPKYIAPSSVPAELHLTSVERFSCTGCESEFLSNASYDGHIQRKSLEITFSCKCDQVTRTFFNMCTFTMFYKDHTAANGNVGHSPSDSFAASVLPVLYMPKEYADLKAKRAAEVEATAASAAAAEAAAAAKAAAEAEAAAKAAAAAEVEAAKAAAAKTAAEAAAGAAALDTAVTSSAAVDISPKFSDKAEETGCEVDNDDEKLVATSPNLEQIPVMTTDSQFNTSDKLNSRIWETACSECNVVYKKTGSLQRHFSLGRAGQETDVLKCEKCFMILPNTCSFKAHSRIHEIKKPFICPECGRLFNTTREVFMQHVKMICFHFSRFTSYVCSLCDYTFSHSIDIINAHFAEKHSKVLYKCSKCPMAFTTLNGFNKHNLENHDNKSVKQIVSKCPVCNVVMMSDVKVHIMNEHGNDEKIKKFYSFRCTVCNSNMETKLDVLKHMKAKHKHLSGVVQTSYVECSALVNQATRPINGENEMGNGNSSAAKETHFEKDSSSNAKDHGFSKKSNEKKCQNSNWSCGRCQMSFNDKIVYRRHKKMHKFVERKSKLHQNKVALDGEKEIKQEPLIPDINVESFSQLQVPSTKISSGSLCCNECDKKFAYNSDLDLHLKEEHNVVCWHPCNLCEKSYIDLDHLRQHHVEVHAGKPPQNAFVCWICAENNEQKSYTKPVMLRRHLQAQHKIPLNQIDDAKIMASSPSNTLEKPPENVDSPDLSVRCLKVNGQANKDILNCSLCEFSAADRESFQQHIRKHRRTTDGQQCLECGSCFSVLPSLKRHLQVVHRIRDFKNYESEIGISLELPADEELKLDFKELYSPEPSKPLFSVAGSHSEKRATRNSEVSDESESLNTTNRDDVFECNVCYKSFDSQSMLRTHLRVHGMAFIQGTRRSSQSVKLATN